MSTVTFQLKPFNAALGADIIGLDPTKAISAGDREALVEAWSKYIVLRIPKHPMTDEQHLAFSRVFGGLDLNPTAQLALKRNGNLDDWDPDLPPPAIGVVSNVVENGKLIGDLGSGEAVWHTDSSFLEMPPAGSALRALEIPPEGGDTSFLNMYAAYDDLPARLKALVDTHSCLHSAVHKSDGTVREGFEEAAKSDPSSLPGAVHALVKIHPVSGRKALFLGRRKGAYIKGLDLAESEQVLDALWEHTIQDKYTWTQVWTVGDVVLWDNRSCMHRRDSFSDAHRRIMHRTQISELVD